jgi:hypothetical protein
LGPVTCFSAVKIHRALYNSTRRNVTVDAIYSPCCSGHVYLRAPSRPIACLETARQDVAPLDGHLYMCCVILWIGFRWNPHARPNEPLSRDGDHQKVPAFRTAWDEPPLLDEKGCMGSRVCVKPGQRKRPQTSLLRVFGQLTCTYSPVTSHIEDLDSSIGGIE